MLLVVTRFVEELWNDMRVLELLLLETEFTGHQLLQSGT
jgi:hypothetical protein